MDRKVFRAVDVHVSEAIMRVSGVVWTNRASMTTGTTYWYAGDPEKTKARMVAIFHPFESELIIIGDEDNERCPKA